MTREADEQREEGEGERIKTRQEEEVRTGKSGWKRRRTRVARGILRAEATNLVED